MSIKTNMKHPIILFIALALIFPSPALASLVFGAATSDRVNYGSGASMDDLTSHTVTMWVYLDSYVDGKTMFGKRANSPVSSFKNRFGLETNATDTNGGLRVAFSQSTSGLTYRTGNAGITAGKWWFLAYTYDSGATPRVHIYRGDLSTIVTETTYATAADGSGTYSTDASQSVIVGNTLNVAGAFADSFPGKISNVAYYNKVLSLAEIRMQQFRPHVTPNTVLFSYLGFTGTGTQPDWSGHQNAGTVTGATTTPHVPLGPAFGW